MRKTVNDLRKQLCEEMMPFTEEAAVLADIIVAYSLCIDRSTLLTITHIPVDDKTEAICENMVRELLNGAPIQYVMGECWFYGLPIKIGKGCFIPRMDTEILAQKVMELLPIEGRFAEVCSGSGCVSKAIMANRSDAEGLALELYLKPLSYTEENLKEFDRIEVRKFDALDPDDYKQLPKLDIIVSNPPYIPTDDVDMLDSVVQCEPRTALDGGEDGLTYYRAIIEYGDELLSEGGRFLFEVGFDQADDVKALLEKKGYDTRCYKDLGGIDRVVEGIKC